MNVNAVVDPGGFLWLQWKPPFWQNFVQFGPLSARVGRRVNCAYAFWVWLSIPARNVLFSTTEFKIVFVYTLHASKLLRVHAQLPLQLAQMVHSITTIPCFEVWLKPLSSNLDLPLERTTVGYTEHGEPVVVGAEDASLVSHESHYTVSVEMSSHVSIHCSQRIIQQVQVKSHSVILMLSLQVYTLPCCYSSINGLLSHVNKYILEQEC